MADIDIYAQQRAVAQSMQEAIDRNERADVLHKLDALAAKLDDLIEFVMVNKKSKKE